MEHIYNCKILNNEEPKFPYNRVFIGNIGEQVSILRRFITNMKQREQIRIRNKENETLNNLHVIQICDPLYNDFVQ